MSHTAAPHDIEFEHGQTHHVTSMARLTTILVMLLIFTGLTVAVSRIDLGETVNLWLAIGIAVVKASLVIAVFMHLLHDKAIDGLVLFFCLLTIGFFMLFTLIDMSSRQMVDPLRAGRIVAPTVVEKAREAAIAEGRLTPSEHETEGADEHAEPTEH